MPGDFGDPLLNAWIVAWDASHLGRGLWNANIFHPHPLALAYSEHLLPQALTILPIRLIAGNPLLGYNLLFLSTFVLSGLGMFLFVREITGSRASAFVAGASFAFAPYRATSIPHLQILSSQWMPFALYGFRRYFGSHAEHAEIAEKNPVLRGPRALRGTLWTVVGGAAWLVQNLSCGYYLLFFSPIVIAYLAWEITVRSLWTNTRVVATVAAAIALVVGATALVMWPYVELRSLGFNPRSLEETAKFSADTYAYLTADPNLRLWGSVMNAWPWAEGALFPGLTIVVLGLIVVAQPYRAAIAGLKPWATLIGFVLSIALLAALLLGFTIRLPVVRITSFSRALLVISALWAIALTASADLRRAVRRWLATPAGFFTLVAVFAVVMSWGPSIHARGRTVASANLYTLFYNFVPGFDGVRVPARFAMIVALALSVLAGLGTSALTRRRVGVALPICLTAAIFVEGLAAPIPVNQNAIDYRQPGLAPLPGSVADIPPVYAAIARLPAGTPILELPLGEPAFDVRYMLYSTTHWQPLVNGYSGGAPADYEQLTLQLQDALNRPEPAWQALLATSASHVVVHEAFYAGDRGRRISAWLLANSAQELATVGSDRIFRIR